MKMYALLLSLFSYLMTCAADTSPSEAHQPTEEQRTIVCTRKTWTCTCYSRCFTRLCKRFGLTQIIPLSTHGDVQPSVVRTRAASRADVELRKRGSNSASEASNIEVRTPTPLPIHIIDKERRLSVAPNSSYEPLPGLSSVV